MTNAQDLDLLGFQVKLGLARAHKRAFVSTGDLENKRIMLPSIESLVAEGVELFATGGTSRFLAEHGIKSTHVHKIAGGKTPNTQTLISSGALDLVVNIRTGDTDYDEQTDSRKIRLLAIEHHVPLITDTDVAIATLARLARDIKEERRRALLPNAEPWNMKKEFVRLVAARAGFANYHAHLDKAYLVNPENLALGQIDMQQKWSLYNSLKENYTAEDLYLRIARGVESMIAQGVTHFRTHIDADPVVKLMAVGVALAVKKDYADRIYMEVGTQPLKGVLDPDACKWFEAASALADVVGGLPSKDRPQPEKHFDIIMGIAKNLGRRLDVHVDQENNPLEDETRLLALKTMEHGMEGRVSAIHSISLSCKPDGERKEVIRMLKDAGISVIVCPSAALSMKQLDMPSRLHNSIAPVVELIEAGVPTVLGTDNIYDFFMPVVDGDMWFECRMLMEACRYYDLKAVADIACDKSQFAH